VTGVVIVIGNTVTSNTSTSASSTATCSAGHVLLSGGATVTTTDTAGKVAVTASYPSSATTWSATGAASALSRGKNWTIKAYAVCTA
jgi:hypothetical protein